MKFCELCFLFLSCIVLLMRQGVCQSEDNDESEKKENVTYMGYGQLTHVVYLKSRVGECAGALLSPDVVLTAAHCFVDAKDPKRRAGNDQVTLMAGIIDISKTSLEYKQERTSKEIIIHPLFKLGRLAGYDLALVFVKTPFQMTETVFKTELWDRPWPQKGNRTMLCQIAGFGSLRDHFHTRLRMWDVVAAHGEESCPCTKRFQWKRMVCTQPTDGAPELCRGESGGALICHDKVVAITHMTRERWTCANLGYPDCKDQASINSFMYVCPFNDWIRQYVPKVPPTPISCRAPHPSVSWGILLLLQSYLLNLQ